MQGHRDLTKACSRTVLDSVLSIIIKACGGPRKFFSLIKSKSIDTLITKTLSMCWWYHDWSSCLIPFSVCVLPSCCFPLCGIMQSCQHQCAGQFNLSVCVWAAAVDLLVSCHSGAELFDVTLSNGATHQRGKHPLATDVSLVTMDMMIDALLRFFLLPFAPARLLFRDKKTWIGNTLPDASGLLWEKMGIVTRELGQWRQGSLFKAPSSHKRRNPVISILNLLFLY